MALIERFEDIKAWQKARILVREVYKMSGTGAFGHDFALRDQIRSAAVSSMSNIAEGFDCDSQKEFARFLEIARRSTVEVQSLLYVAVDVGYISRDEFTKQYSQAVKTKGLIGGFRHSLLQRLKQSPKKPTT